VRVAVVGAGIVGLHVAAEAVARGHETYLLEREARLGEHTSGRNSGVVHSGIFYSPGSLKERLCIEGNARTWAWLTRLGVPHRRCGKLVLPDLGDESGLEALAQKAAALGIPPVEQCTAARLRELEPRVAGTVGLFVPSTGVVDAAAYLEAMRTHCRSSGVELLTRCEVAGVDATGALQTSRGALPFDVAVNAAGLFADRVAEAVGLAGYGVRPTRGDYYVLPETGWLSRPVYHVARPGDPGLGVHLTPTLDGHVLLGPNVVSLASEARLDYRHASAPAAFEASLARYLPEADPRRLAPGWSGNRPKLTFEGRPVGDFVLQRQGAWVHALGIESPGLTAAPALARALVDLL
jgi:L-2-hydroxyglutarate oxidase LhgO